MGQHRNSVEQVKIELRACVDVQDLGALSHFLGITFKRDEKGAWLDQKHYIAEILKRFGMNQCNTVDTPMVTKYWESKFWSYADNKMLTLYK